ncbi:unnamed protein product [Pleuronectes platessa]|uniref:Uncharacterized protein n=1 Tax=Pleuronectes platessa TaxID=8262 RepID=A0A9N7TQB7_PLEPL|nr:unnamed protein product [Pleuronectes platessa]
MSQAKDETHLHTLPIGFPAFTPTLFPPPLLLLLTSLEWVQMCEPQTLPLWSPYWTHRAQHRLADSLKSSWPKEHTQSHHFAGDCVKELERLGKQLSRCFYGDTKNIKLPRSPLQGHHLALISEMC